VCVCLCVCECVYMYETRCTQCVWCVKGVCECSMCVSIVYMEYRMVCMYALMCVCVNVVEYRV